MLRFPLNRAVGVLALFAAAAFAAAAVYTASAADRGGRGNGPVPPDEPHAALFQAAREGDVAALKAAIDADPELLHATTGGRSTLLHQAAWQDQTPAIEYLVAKGLPVDVRDAFGATPLHEAAQTGRLEAAKALVRLGADLKDRATRPPRKDGSKSIPGRSVLSAAAHGGHPEVVSWLLAEGAPVVYGERHWQSEGWPLQTALHWACIAGTDWTDPRAKADRLAVIDLLAQRLDDINVKASGFEEKTVLHVAAEHRQPEIVRFLLENYPAVDVSATDEEGNTPMQSAQLARPPENSAMLRRQSEQDAAEVVRLLEKAREERLRRGGG